VSTRNERQTSAGREPRDPARARIRGGDPVEELALVALARRELLLRAHRHRLRPEDLEDCYSQATLELLTRANGGARFSGRQHLENALEQKFVSRIHDRRRALGGRSPMQAALETAMSIGGAVEEQTDVADVRAELEKLVMLRADLRRLASLAERLTPDQRSVLAWQLAQRSRADFCSRYGWSPEKYRKVAQRARTRLRRLMETEEGVPAGAPSSEQATGKIL
jgi:DNA-directed RNA polymerase specialized sigma24 family protein